MNEAGTISFAWSPDGTLASRITAVSTVAVPADSTRVSIKVTLDVNNGAAGNDVVFAPADSTDGTSTQSGTTVTTAGVTRTEERREGKDCVSTWGYGETQYH